MPQPDQLAEMFGIAVEAVADPLVERIKYLEATVALLLDREPVAGPVGPQGEKGEPGAVGPAGADGREGRDGLSGIPGRDGLNGEKGLDGKDGANGTDGLDGFGFDDMDEHYEDDGRILVRTYRMGERVKEFRHVTTQPVWRRRYEPGKVYQKGDVVVWSGSSWIAEEDTKSEPGSAAAASRAWSQMVRKGDTGKSGQKGLTGDRGPQGPEGPRGPQGY
jgi:hypothetical protein